MTTLHRLTLTLRPQQLGELLAWSGVAVRDALLALVRSHDAALHDHLIAGDGPRAFSVGPLMTQGMARTRLLLDPAEPLRCQFVALHDDLAALLATIAPQLPGTALMIGGLPLTIEATDSDRTDAAQLVERHLLGETVGRTLELTFVSPVAFRSRHVDLPFPQPEWVLGGLVDRWNACCAVKLPAQARQFAAECIHVQYYRMRSQWVRFGDSPYSDLVGGVGTVRYHIFQGDAYWRRVMHTLAAFAAYAGAGLRTSAGMGCVQVTETGPARSATRVATHP